MQIDVEPVSAIGENSYFGGRFLVKGSMRIDGCFEGNALMVDQLAIGAKGRVKTNITATSVVVEGIVIGNIEASRRVLLLSTARVLGDLRTPELIIQEGVVLEGRCTIGRAQVGSTREHIESLFASKAARS
jgi:cytoskeletal protein CcmA (bactofilin family)